MRCSKHVVQLVRDMGMSVRLHEFESFAKKKKKNVNDLRCIWLISCIPGQHSTVSCCQFILAQFIVAVNLLSI